MEGPVSDIGVGENLAMTRAVHGLQSVLLLFHLKGEHVLLVVTPVARGLPEICLVHVRGYDLREASLPILALDEIHQCAVDACAVRQEEGRSG